MLPFQCITLEPSRTIHFGAFASGLAAGEGAEQKDQAGQRAGAGQQQEVGQAGPGFGHGDAGEGEQEEKGWHNHGARLAGGDCPAKGGGRWS